MSFGYGPPADKQEAISLIRAAAGLCVTCLDAAEASLRRLQMDHTGLLYRHRLDPDVPIEEAAGAVNELIQAGKVEHLGLAEAEIRDIRRAPAGQPVTALQSQYALSSREPEAGTVPTPRVLELVPFSPSGKQQPTTRGVTTCLIQSSLQHHTRLSLTPHPTRCA